MNDLKHTPLTEALSRLEPYTECNCPEDDDGIVRYHSQCAKHARKHLESAKIAASHIQSVNDELLQAQTMGAELNTPDFMDWIADRLVNVHGESEYIDYVQSLRFRAKAGRAAIAKATGKESA